MKTLITISWFVSLTAAYVFGYGWGVCERYDEVERIVQFQYNQQIKQAVREGIPFKLRGTEVSIYPREDGHVNVTVAKAEKQTEE
jgi:hypothetical protein